MAISISWLWLKTRGRDQTSISPRPTSLADPLAACRFASKPESSHQRWRGTGPERSGFQYIEIPNILVRQPALSCRNREQRAHHGKIHHRRAVVERLQYDRRRSRPSIDGLHGSLGGQTLELVPTLHGWKREAGREGMAATQRHRFYMGGNEKLVGRGWRQLSDTVFTLNPSSRVTGYVE